MDLTQNLTELRQQKGQLANEADAILTKAREEGRNDLRKDEDEKFEKIHTDIESLTKQILRLEKQQTTMASLAEPQNGGRRTTPDKVNPDRVIAGGKITEADRVEAFRTWALAGAGVEIDEAKREHAKRCGLPIEAKRISLHFGPRLKPTHFADGSLRVQPEDLRTWQREMDEKRAALTAAQSTTTTGGYTTADAAMRALEVALLAFGGMRSVGTVLRTDTGGPLPIPTSNDTSNKGEIIGENTTNNELEMTFGQLVLDAWKYSSKYILASVEFLQDSSINVAEFIGSALGDRIGRIQNDHFTTGTGSSQPNGVVTAGTSSGVTFSGTNTVTYDNIIDLIHSIDPAYRNNGRFMFHDGGLKMLKKVKVLQYSGDTSGYPLWTPGLALGQPDLIAGYPYIVNFFL